MKVYVVINKFKDLENEHIYDVDSIYPFNLESVDEKRIKELSTKDNLMKKVLIKEKEFSNLSTKQLLEYAEIKNIDIKETIISLIESKENNKSNENDKNNKNTSDNQKKDK